MQLFLLTSISIFIGLGYYISSISLIIILFVIDYFLDGIFDFFVNDDKDSYEEDESISSEIEDIDVDVIDEG